MILEWIRGTISPGYKDQQTGESIDSILQKNLQHTIAQIQCGRKICFIDWPNAPAAVGAGSSSQPSPLPSWELSPSSCSDSSLAASFRAKHSRPRQWSTATFPMHDFRATFWTSNQPWYLCSVTWTRCSHRTLSRTRHRQFWHFDRTRIPWLAGPSRTTPSTTVYPATSATSPGRTNMRTGIRRASPVTDAPLPCCFLTAPSRRISELAT